MASSNPSVKYQAVAMKRESQLLFHIHRLFGVLNVFHDYRDSDVTAASSGFS